MKFVDRLPIFLWLVRNNNLDLKLVINYYPYNLDLLVRNVMFNSNWKENYLKYPTLRKFR